MIKRKLIKVMFDLLIGIILLIIFNPTDSLSYSVGALTVLLWDVTDTIYEECFKKDK